MKDRLIDTSLLVVLIVVALIIFWTLLNSFGFNLNLFSSISANRNSGSENPIVSDTKPPSSDIVEIIPTDANPSLEALATNVNGDILAIDPNDLTLVPTAQQIQEPASIESDNVLSENTVPEDVSEASPSIVPVAEGSLELERIGFSSITGGVGACNVVLEPWKHIAVSRDIRATHPCGSELTVRLETPVAGRESFTGIVADTMNPSKTKTVNIYVANQDLALEYGVNGGVLEP